MTKDKKETEVSEKNKDISAEVTKPSENKIRFLTWFVGALELFKGLKPHHMASVQAYMNNLGINDPSTQEIFDEGLIKFGFRRD